MFNLQLLERVEEKMIIYYRLKKRVAIALDISLSYMSYMYVYIVNDISVILSMIFLTVPNYLIKRDVN